MWVQIKCLFKIKMSHIYVRANQMSFHHHHQSWNPQPPPVLTSSLPLLQKLRSAPFNKTPAVLKIRAGWLFQGSESAVWSGCSCWADPDALGAGGHREDRSVAEESEGAIGTVAGDCLPVGLQRCREDLGWSGPEIVWGHGWLEGLKSWAFSAPWRRSADVKA